MSSLDYVNRDDFCIALSDLYGYDPTDYDGLTLAEISQQISVTQLEEVCRYLGVEA